MLKWRCYCCCGHLKSLIKEMLHFTLYSAYVVAIVDAVVVVVADIAVSVFVVAVVVVVT